MEENKQLSPEADDAAVLRSVMTAAREKMTAEPTEANIKAFQAARRALEEVENAGAPSGRVFKDRTAVLDYLQRENYYTIRGLIQKSKVYKDSKPGGPLKLSPDKSVTEAAVLDYISKAGLYKPKKDAAAGGAGILDRRKEKDVEKLEEQIKSLKASRLIKMGQYIKREDHYLELAARAAIFEAFFRFKILMETAAIVEGLSRRNDIEKKVQYLENTLIKILETGLTELAGISNYQVMFDLNEEDDIEQELGDGDG